MCSTVIYPLHNSISSIHNYVMRSFCCISGRDLENSTYLEFHEKLVSQLYDRNLKSIKLFNKQSIYNFRWESIAIITHIYYICISYRRTWLHQLCCWCGFKKYIVCHASICLLDTFSVVTKLLYLSTFWGRECFLRPKNNILVYSY